MLQPNRVSQLMGGDRLEVVGVACEMSGSFTEQARRVQAIRDRSRINYRLLLGSDYTTCPVRTQFGVKRFPTLVLLDATSRIIWSQEGLTASNLQELEWLIRHELEAR